ncbi:acetyl-CoA carboxylase biotin carboxyl carrier protein [Pseudalkalibacillus hwajinpoensis]|uniref:Biotin carboxyl carrier protein of acetyl-CoA carboxylase n=1 Tax=Guptibacillus hwajinpoensis TaxID=208199 RepID=A0A4U1MLM9_9BACL|nr:acetyl-CoA carboxylase biotin carboxyl carrier protein [Pseudalkalibacillus hwajinpoensis]TKD72409.1 acetyl-CoA carboxylase biotin carboxyl carrier protein [Pseudalkalibacillus hwajinpoensis]
MLNSKEIIEIITYVNGSTVDEVHYEHESFVVKVKNQNLNGERNNQDSSTEQVPSIVKERGQEDISPEPVKTTPDEESKTHTVTSPMVGMFYASPSPDDAVFVNVGDHVSEETVVCVLEAMKMFNDVQADVNGEIIDILVQNGDLVEFGQPLFKVKAE